MVQVRDALPLPADGSATVTSDVRRIDFRHPGYPDSSPPLLQLAAVDDDGVDYDTGLVACGILTGNRFYQGWLGLRQFDGTLHRLDRPVDGILREPVYYYCVSEDTTERYPVLPSFDHWRFPHDEIPSPWSSLIFPSSPTHAILKHKPAAMVRDGSCRITGYTDAIEAAHLVPLAAGYWFESNRMARYCRLGFDHHAVNDEKNLLVLRRDIHHLFDQRVLVFIPKQSLLPPSSGEPGEAQNVQLVAHVLLPRGSAQLVQLYHNRLLQPIAGVSPELLLARFAWALFADENMPFFRGSHEYAVLLFSPTTGCTESHTLRSSQVRERANVFEPFSRSRSVSPKKRQLEETDDWDDDTGGWSDSTTSGQRVVSREEARGRPRKRRIQEWPQHDPSAYKGHEFLDSAKTSTTAGNSQGLYSEELEESGRKVTDYPGIDAIGSNL